MMLSCSLIIEINGSQDTVFRIPYPGVTTSFWAMWLYLPERNNPVWSVK